MEIQENTERIFTCQSKKGLSNCDLKSRGNKIKNQ